MPSYCMKCKKVRSNYHKCHECGQFLHIEPDDHKFLEQELSEIKRGIRSKYTTQKNVVRGTCGKSDTVQQKLWELEQQEKQEIERAMAAGKN